MAQCPTHPGAEAVGTCTRCGRFFCLAERFELDDRFYCGECGAREDVDWLGHHYRKLEGKRSGLAWVMLVLGMAMLAGGVGVLLTPQGSWREVLVGLGVMLYGALCTAFFTGRARARPALLIGSVVTAAAFVVGIKDFVGLIPAAVTVLLTAAAWRDVRTRLFYRRPVERLVLHTHYQREGSNPLAVSASRLSLLAFFVPGLCFVTLVMGAIALSRIDSKAVPPVGNLSAAIAAIVVSLLMSVVWVSAFAAPFLRGY